MINIIKSYLKQAKQEKLLAIFIEIHKLRLFQEDLNKAISEQDLAKVNILLLKYMGYISNFPNELFEDGLTNKNYISFSLEYENLKYSWTNILSLIDMLDVNSLNFHQSICQSIDDFNFQLNHLIKHCEELIIKEGFLIPV